MKTFNLSIIYFFFSFFNLFAQSEKDSLKATKDSAQANGLAKPIFFIVEQMPEFPGGQSGLTHYLNKNITYPLEAKKNGVEGTVYVNFIVTETGDLEDVKIQKGLSKECDEEVVRVMRNMPKWKPGKQSRKPVSVRLTYPFRFKLEDNVANSSDSSTVTPSEQMPSFPGGQEVLLKYLKKELKYPQEAYRRGIEGIVYLSFIIEEDGSLSNIVVQRGILRECDEEAIRVVKNMPNWIPGKQMGIAVPVRFSLPIRFKAR